MTGIAKTFASNLVTVTTNENVMSGYIALGVTAWSKNSLRGMVVGVLVRYLDDHFNGRQDYSRRIWTLFIFIVWYDIYFEDGKHAEGDWPDFRK